MLFAFIYFNSINKIIIEDKSVQYVLHISIKNNKYNIRCYQLIDLYRWFLSCQANCQLAWCSSILVTSASFAFTILFFSFLVVFFSLHSSSIWSSLHEFAIRIRVQHLICYSNERTNKQRKTHDGLAP